jgi:uncharacterized protein with ATP-grasp and redox domains
MKAKLDCIPCMFNQAYRAAKTATTDEKLIREVLNRAGELVDKIDLSLTPPEAAMPIYKLVEEVTGNSDPYHFEKIKHIKTALELYPLMKEKTKNAENSLKEAIKIAIAGNAIDLGSTLEAIDVKAQFEEMDRGKFVLNDFDELQARLKNTDSVLFLADNAGETVFDRPLIEELVSLGKTVIYAVKEKPIINDATYEDAVLSGISCRIVSTGSSIAGTVVSSCSENFRHLLYNAKLIIAKGQGNYETLSDEKAPIFFLFKVKCNPISEDTGFPVGSMLLLKSKNFIE